MDNENKSEQNHASASNSAPKPRAKSAAAEVTWVGMFGASVGLDVMTAEPVKKFFKEQPNDWADPKVGDSFLKRTGKGFAKLVDPKQWKSTAVSLGILAAGYVAATYTHRKIEENAYQKNMKNSPSFEPEALKETALEAVKTDETESITDVEHQGKLAQLDKEQTLSP